MALSLFSGSAGGNQQQQSFGHMDADEGGSRAPGLEVQLAGIMEQLLTDRVGAKDAIGLLEGVYNAAAERLRAESSQQLHRPARFMRIKALAQEMQCQAATWHLVWCLYCNPGSPAGIGGPSVPDAGDQRTYRQQLADKACMDPLLARVANVVAWLESLAADELAQQGVPRFADHDGVWIETRQAAGAGSLSELDPDAPGRQGKALQADNAKAEERLMARLWQLVRAGRIKDARALCRQCGQPWRAASLGGAGPHGPLPVGIAATRQDDDATPDQQAEDLAVETASGAGTLRALWKWACLQVSEQAGRGLVGAAGRYEAALYGALSGNVSAVLPACGTWEDACWAYCRAWLDLSTDQALGVTRQAPHELVGGEVLMGVLQRCGLAGAGAAAGSGPAALDGALSVVLGGQWPSPALLAQQQHGGLGGGRGAAELPRSFDAVFEALACSAEPAISTATREPLHMVQKLLVQDRLAGLTAHLHRWLVARGELPDPAEDTGAGQDASGPAAADDGVEGVAGLPARHPRMVAFAAHMLLLLEGLGDAAASVDGGLDHASGMREQVAVLYVAQLLEAGRPDTVSLVPQYLPLLRPPNRELLSQEMLSLLTQQLMAAAESATSAAGLAGSGAWAEADALCARVYCSMAAWFQACLIRQEAQDAEEQAAREAAAMGVVAMAPDEPATSNALRTTVRPDEARILLNTFLESCRLSPAHGPLHRARAARWLAYPLLHPTAASGFSAAAATTDGAIAELAEPAAFCDALHLACALCSELALGDGVTATAAHHLLSEVLPADVESWAGQVAEQLREQATADGGEGGAQGMDEDAEEDTAAAEASRATASELEALASELAQWRVYLELDNAMRGWEGRYGRYKAGEGGEGREALAEGARELLDGMLGRLLQAGWMGGLAAHERAAWADVSSGGAEGDGGGRIEVELALTCVGGAGQGLEGEGAGVGGWGVAGDAPFPSLKGATLFEAESRIRSALQLELQAQSQALGGGGPEQQQRQLQQQLDVQVLSPEGADGFVRVLMACQPSAEAWGRMLGLAVALLQGSLDGLPTGLLLVNLRAGRATSAAICRRCCLGQVVLHCSLLRQALVELGGDGSDGEALVELLADPNDAGAASFAVGVSGTGAGGEGLRLLEVLSAPMLRRVLQAEADTVVALMQQQQQQRRQQQQQQQQQRR